MKVAISIRASDCRPVLALTSCQRNRTNFRVVWCRDVQPGDFIVAAVLLIDDMNLVRGAVKSILTRAGHAVTEAAGGEAGISMLQNQPFDLRDRYDHAGSGRLRRAELPEGHA